MSEAVIRATVNTNMAEQVAVARTILWRAASYWLLFGLFVGPPTAGVVVAAVMRAQDERRPEAAMAIVAVLCAALWWFFPWYIVWLSRRGTPHANGPFEYVLDESVVRLERPSAATEYKWIAFERARETDRFFLLYVRRHLAYFIPRRVLAVGDAERLRTLLARQLGDRAQLLKVE